MLVLVSGHLTEQTVVDNPVVGHAQFPGTGGHEYDNININNLKKKKLSNKKSLVS